jgi:DNA-binding response OmpR family regulator
LKEQDYLIEQDLSLIAHDSGPLKDETILIVEDNSDLRYYLKENLRHRYSVLEASNGVEGMRKSINSIPDLVITDLMMPEMDGFQLCANLKKNDLTCHIPIILLTVKDDVASQTQGLEVGAEDYISKPFEISGLLSKVKSLLFNRKKIHDHYRKQSLLTPRKIEALSLNEKFLQKTMETIESQLSDPLFSVEIFADAMCISQAQLYRKLKALTNFTPNELIRNVRLERAALLLKQRSGTVAEVGYQVGFSGLSYFSKVFKDKFGTTPSEFN